MNMVYNSPNYCVVQFSDYGDSELHPDGGYEIMDKCSRREIFLDGDRARQFRDDIDRLISVEPSLDDFDDFLAGYTGLMLQPVVVH